MVTYLKEADQKNCPEASYALAVYYSSGVESNIIDLENTKAEEQWARYLYEAAMFGNDDMKHQYLFYLKKSYEMPQSDSKNYVDLGDCYYKGICTDVDYKKALEIYEKYRDTRESEYIDCLNKVNREKGDLNE